MGDWQMQALDANRELISELEAENVRLRLALLKVVNECEGHRFGQARYDMTLDDLYETASAALGGEGSEC